MEMMGDRVAGEESGETLGIGLVGPRTAAMEHIAAVLRARWAAGPAVRRSGTEKGFARSRQRWGEYLTRLKVAGQKVRRPASRAGGRRADTEQASVAELYLVNALGPNGKTEPRLVARMVRSVRFRSPHAAIVVVLDESNPDALRAAREAGATEYLGAREAANDEAIRWRVWDAVRDSRKPAPLAPGESLLPRARVTPRAAPADAEAAAARAAVERAVDDLPTPAERVVRASELVEVDAPALRDWKTGRLDAGRIAAALGVPVSRLAAVAGVTQQALSRRPDSPGAQAGLQPVARVIAALGELLPAGHTQMWLNTPLRKLGGETPLAMILGGRADKLARIMERALDGGSE
jgi:hypothetical protein